MPDTSSALAAAILDTTNRALRTGTAPWERKVALLQIRDFASILVVRFDHEHEEDDAS